MLVIKLGKNTSVMSVTGLSIPRTIFWDFHARLSRVLTGMENKNYLVLWVGNALLRSEENDQPG